MVVDVEMQKNDLNPTDQVDEQIKPLDEGGITEGAHQEPTEDQSFQQSESKMAKSREVNYIFGLLLIPGLVLCLLADADGLQAVFLRHGGMVS